MTLVLGLLAAVVWGSSDFVAGLTSRRTPAGVVLGWSLAVAAVLTSAAVLSAGPLPPGRWWLWGSLSGVVGTLGLCALYAGLAAGRMGVVAPVAACGVVVPVVVGLLGGDPVGALVVIGLLCAVVGIVLASGPELRTGAKGERAGLPVLLALLAALGLGASLVLVERGSHSSVLHTLWSLKVVGALVVLLGALVVRRVGVPPRATLPGILLVGAADLGANVLYALAATRGPLSVVSVLASLYPVATVALATLVLHERLRPVQGIGVVLALLGVVLLAAG